MEYRLMGVAVYTAESDMTVGTAGPPR